MDTSANKKNYCLAVHLLEAIK